MSCLANGLGRGQSLLWIRCARKLPFRHPYRLLPAVRHRLRGACPDRPPSHPHSRRVRPGNAWRARRVECRGERHPRLAAGAVLRLRLDRLRAHSRDHDRRLFGSEQLRVGPAHGLELGPHDDTCGEHRPRLEKRHHEPFRTPLGQFPRCRPSTGTVAGSAAPRPFRVGRRRHFVEALAPAAPEAPTAFGRARSLGRGLADPGGEGMSARRRAETHLELASRVVSAGVLSTEAELALCDLASAATSAWYGRSSPKEASASQAIADALAVVRSTAERP